MHNQSINKGKVTAVDVFNLDPSIVGRDSIADIAINYGLDGPGIESRWGLDFPHPFSPVLGPNQPPIKWVPGLFPEVKASGAWR